MALDLQRLQSIKLLALDVDGILTDCRVWYDSSGEWRRMFCLRDGLGMKTLQEKGYKIALITASDAEDIRQRAKKLSVDFFYEGRSDKWPAFLDLQHKSGFKAHEIAYMGDDLQDLPLLEAAGFSATVPEAIEEAKTRSHYITRTSGGHGAVREVCDHILRYGALA